MSSPARPPTPISSKEKKESEKLLLLLPLTMMNLEKKKCWKTGDGLRACYLLLIEDGISVETLQCEHNTCACEGVEIG